LEAAPSQLAERREALSLAARSEGGRYGPAIQEVDSLQFVRSAVEPLDAGLVSVEGEGAKVRVDVAAAERALRALARCALRHGGLEHVSARVAGAEVAISPITRASAPGVMGED